MKYLHSLPRPWRGYAAWTRRQASTMNCGAPAGAVLLGAGVVVLVVAAYWAVIWPVLVMIFWGVVACCGLILAGLISWGITAGIVAWRRRAARQAPPPARLVPVCGDCRRAPASAEVTYANGRRSDTTYTCDACWTAEEQRAAVPPQFRQVSTLMTSGLPAYAEIAPAPALPGDAPHDPRLPSGPGYGKSAHLPDADAEVPVAPDNRAASDPGTAADLAAVLGRTGQWTRQHP